MKILIMGMHRSGTTMTSSLFELHPEIKRIFNEVCLLCWDKKTLLSMKKWPDWKLIQNKGILYRAKNVNLHWDTIDFDPIHDSWGENLSHIDPVISEKAWKKPAYEYIKTWYEYFKDDAACIHIVRHPFDVFISARRRWKNDEKYEKDNGKLTLENICEKWADTTKQIIENCDGKYNILRVKYEDILYNPSQMLKKIFKHCNLDSSKKTLDKIINGDVVFFGKINKDRAFVYKKIDEKFQINNLCLKNKINELFKLFDYDKI